MRNWMLCLIIGSLMLTSLPGCQWPVFYYATNTLNEPCTIRMKFSDQERMRYKKDIRYSNIVITKVNSTTEQQLKDTLQVKRISATILELTLPPKSTAIIDGRSSVDGSLDSIFFISASKTLAYSRASYSKKQKVSGGPFSKLAQSSLYTFQ